MTNWQIFREKTQKTMYLKQDKLNLGSECSLGPAQEGSRHLSSLIAVIINGLNNK